MSANEYVVINGKRYAAMAGVGAKTSSGEPAGLVALGDLLAGEDQANDVIKIEKQNGYELIAVSQTAVVPGGGTGAIGDFLEAIIVKQSVGTITILDGPVAILVIPASTIVGTRFEFNLLAKTTWKITTAAGTQAICVGRFT